MAKKRSYKEAEKALQSLRDQSDSLGRQYDKNFENILSSTDQVADAQELINDLAREHNKLLAEGRKEQAGSVKAEYDAVKQLQEKSKLLNETKKGYSQINDQLQDIASNLQGMVEKLPGGKTLSKLFGVDKLGEGITTALNKSAAAFMSTGGSISAATSAFTRGIAAAINPFTIIAVIVAGLVASFLEFEKKAKGVAEATGLTLQQSKALVSEAKSAATSMGVQLSTSKDILAVQQATIKEFGIANMLSASQAANVSEIGKAFSIGAENAAAVTNEFMRMGMSGDGAADALLQVSAESLKAGVSVGTVTADIAANAKDVAKFFGGNVKALREAAVEAAKLGISLKTMADVADNLLRFEDSIASQFEFQAMTGKMINLDKARQLALDGKIAEASQEVLSNVGSLAEFEAMRPLAQRKLAEATGMGVDELTKSLAIQSKLSDLSADQQAAMANMGLSAAEIKNMSAEDLKNKLAQQQSTDQLSASFSALKDDFTKALIPAGEVLMRIFKGLVPVIKGIGFLFKMIGGIIDIFIIQPINFVLDAVDSIASFVKKIPFGSTGINAPMSLPITQTGDLAINPNGGPVVMSPQEGGIFQGTRNDGVSMSPSSGLPGPQGSQGPAGASGTGNTAIANAIAKTNALLQQILDTGTTIEMDGQVVAQTIRTSDSFRRR
jgi:hypothetical protein